MAIDSELVRRKAALILEDLSRLRPLVGKDLDTSALVDVPEYLSAVETFLVACPRV
jgi:hypothetical protein